MNEPFRDVVVVLGSQARVRAVVLRSRTRTQSGRSEMAGRPTVELILNET